MFERSFMFHLKLKTMKKFMFAMLVLVSGTAALAQLSKDKLAYDFNPGDNAEFKWNETSFDFGKIKLNVPVTHEFTFTNKGNATLTISSVQASCGCTVAQYSKEPIEPGQQGFVKATYNAAKAGVFTKTVTINANTEIATVVLTIKGEVVAE